MKLKYTLVLTALAVAFNGFLVVHAVDEKQAKQEKAEKAQPAAKKAKRHDRAEQNKPAETLITHDDCCRDPSKLEKKPAHDHSGGSK